MRITNKPETHLLLLELVEAIHALEPKAIKKMIVDANALTAEEQKKREESLAVIATAEKLNAELEEKLAKASDLEKGLAALAKAESSLKSDIADFSAKEKALAKMAVELDKKQAELVKAQDAITAANVEIHQRSASLDARESAVIAAEEELKMKTSQIKKLVG